MILELTEIQNQAVQWNNGPLLVLAGPGSGKTQVLTCRIAKLLETSANERFRILALTFTNKASHEMKTRISSLVPGLEERVDINTFHGFCAQLLRQHGVHLGIKPNFEIYSRKNDREALLQDALRDHSNQFNTEDINLLPRIDSLKSRLIGPDEALQYLKNKEKLLPDEAHHINLAYKLYDKKMKSLNALDFNSLIYFAYKLMEYPAISKLCQTIYQYWHIDELQDTNGSQYRLLRQMAGEDFRNLFAVADDDQTIYEWNGANVGRIKDFIRDFGCEVIQLTDNFRCPPRIVEAANRLIVHNVQHDKSKQLAIATKPPSEDNVSEIRYLAFPCDKNEARSIATEIENLGVCQRSNTAVLARNHALLGPLKEQLEKRGIPNSLLGRRDDFSSPQMRWVVACLKQINRPLDKRNMSILNRTFSSFSGMNLDTEEVVLRSEMGQVNLLTAWIDSVKKELTPGLITRTIEILSKLAFGDIKMPEAAQNLINNFNISEEDGDFKDDLSAWGRIESEIRNACGRTVSLVQYLQEMELRSKEPNPKHGAVSLGTIHGSKGMEFDRVYLIGLAEEVLPSWHSIKKGNGAALEEERRNCFVAITRTKKHLVLSGAKSYNNWTKDPSRFLGEMGVKSSGSKILFEQ